MERLPLLVDPAELAEHLEDPRVVVLDATVDLDRPPGGGPYVPRSGREAFARERIPGARFADLVGALADPAAPHPFAWPDAGRAAAALTGLGVGPQTHVVAYAQASPMWATRLWFLLRGLGHDAASVLDGGLTAWKAAGLPISSGPPEPAAHADPPFAAQPRPELLAGREEVEAIAAGDGAACLVNALRPEQFRGEGPSSYARAGRIPRSTSLPHTALLDPETQRLRPHDELTHALRDAGLLDGATPVVAYCGGGISATVDLFALALAGRTDARLYDGSLAEWTADPSLPVELG